MKIKSQHELQRTISLHYSKNENTEVILKTALACEMALTLGLNSMSITLKMVDLGVKQTEIGLAMALALKKTEDKFLSEIDQEIKKIVLKNYSKMIEELEAVI